MPSLDLLSVYRHLIGNTRIFLLFRGIALLLLYDDGGGVGDELKLNFHSVGRQTIKGIVFEKCMSLKHTHRKYVTVNSSQYSWTIRFHNAFTLKIACWGISSLYYASIVLLHALSYDLIVMIDWNCAPC